MPWNPNPEPSAVGAPPSEPQLAVSEVLPVMDEPEGGYIETSEAQVSGPATQSLYWCPKCHLVRHQSGPCPSCQRDLVPAIGSLPYGPYQPVRQMPRKGIRFGGALLTLLVLALPVVVGAWLYRTGAPIPTGPSDGLVHTTAQTSANFPELGTVKLPGTWVADPITEADLSANLNADGGKANVLTVQRSGNTVIWEASISVSGTGASTGANQCKVIPTGNGTPTIAGLQAERSDATVTCPGNTSYVREYDMKDKDATLVLKIVGPTPSTPFDQIENAFLALPGSNPGGVTV